MVRRSRGKAFSDPEISLTPRAPSIQQVWCTMSFPNEPRDHRSTYGSLDASHSASTVRPLPSAACCVAGQHLITSGSQEFIRRSLSLNSIVNVDISDIAGDGEAPIVPISLRKCKKMILTPYTVLLSVIGWRPWMKDNLTQIPWFWSFVNCIYPVFVVMAMLYHFVFQILSCQGKYNIHKDTLPEVTTETIPTTITEPTNEPSILKDVQNCTCYNHTSNDIENLGKHVFCLHIFPTYVVPSVMHFLAFSYGFVHFRIQECEQLYSLMERVFLQAYSTPGVQGILIRNSRLYLFGATTWLVLQFATELLYYFTFNIKLHGGLFDLKITELLPALRYSLIVLKFIGLMLAQCVNVAVVLNYCMQCEMLIFHIKGVCLRLHEKTAEIMEAMHEILGLREFISTLNEQMGKMVAFCIVNFTELTIVGTALLILNQNTTDKKVLTYRIIFPALWFAALLLPLLQAARLTRIGTKLRQISFEMRVFGYQLATQSELDSFVLFVNGATLRTKLFGATISPASVILTFGGAAFVILTLMVVDLVTISGYKAI